MLRICQESLSSWNGQTKKLEGARIFIHTVTVKQQLYIYICIHVHLYGPRRALVEGSCETRSAVWSQVLGSNLDKCESPDLRHEGV